MPQWAARGSSTTWRAGCTSPAYRRASTTGPTSKGRGFQGVVKRYGIGGGPNTHGNTKHRRPGSIGPGTDPSRVIKGKKMPGHYGAERHTQIGLRVEKIDAERNLIYVRGAVPGAPGTYIIVRKAVAQKPEPQVQVEKASKMVAKKPAAKPAAAAEKPAKK